MANRIVIGSQWGDEGKAKVVDYLTLESDYIIRFQGGANAGHTVVVGEEEFVFHLIPSGIMHPTKICCITNGVVLDPAQLLIELGELKEKGIVPGDRLKIADNAHVVLPFHKVLDQLKEIKAGKDAIGTTGRGIGPCYSDKVNRLGFRVGDMLERPQLERRIRAIAEVKNHEIVTLFDGEALDVEAIIEEYWEYGQLLKQYICDTTDLSSKALKVLS